MQQASARQGERTGKGEGQGSVLMQNAPRKEGSGALGGSGQLYQQASAPSYGSLRTGPYPATRTPTQQLDPQTFTPAVSAPHAPYTPAPASAVGTAKRKGEMGPPSLPPAKKVAKPAPSPAQPTQRQLRPQLPPMDVPRNYPRHGATSPDPSIFLSSTHHLEPTHNSSIRQEDHAGDNMPLRDSGAEDLGFGQQDDSYQQYSPMKPPKESAPTYEDEYELPLPEPSQAPSVFLDSHAQFETYDSNEQPEAGDCSHYTYYTAPDTMPHQTELGYDDHAAIAQTEKTNRPAQSITSQYLTMLHPDTQGKVMAEVRGIIEAEHVSTVFPCILCHLYRESHVLAADEKAEYTRDLKEQLTDAVRRADQSDSRAELSEAENTDLRGKKQLFERGYTLYVHRLFQHQTLGVAMPRKVKLTDLRTQTATSDAEAMTESYKVKEAKLKEVEEDLRAELNAYKAERNAAILTLVGSSDGEQEPGTLTFLLAFRRET